MRSFLALAVSAALAGRVAAELKINVTGLPDNRPANQMIDIPNGSKCTPQCNTAKDTINACNGDDTCLCSTNTTGPFVDCNQCIFQELIDTNAKPQLLAGSNVAVGAYQSACNATGHPTAAPLALVAPAGFLGPRDIILNTPETVVTVGFGGILGASFLYILSNL